MRILVFMVDNRPLDPNDSTADYNTFAAVINYEYCKRHNYDFKYYTPYLSSPESRNVYNCMDPHSKETRHASWSKLLATIQSFELAYDYIVYIDSDCIFKDYNQSLENYIRPYETYDVCFLNNNPWHPNLPCAGFYVCKANDSAKQFIVDWYNVNLAERNKQHPWEQDALWKIFKQYNVGIINDMMFYERSQQFLRHISGHVSREEEQNRIPYFKSFIHRYSIDYSAHVSNIIVNAFNTAP